MILLRYSSITYLLSNLCILVNNDNTFLPDRYSKVISKTNEQNECMNYVQLINTESTQYSNQYYSKTINTQFRYPSFRSITCILLILMSNLTQNSYALPIFISQQQQQNNFNPSQNVFIQQENSHVRSNNYPYLSNQYLPQNSQQTHLNTYKVYKHQPVLNQIPQYPNVIQPQQQQQRLRVPSYSNGGLTQILDQTAYSQNNVNNNIGNSSIIQQNIQQVTNNIRRERQRRAMIDKMLILFDDDGNGQLDANEFFSMSLRTNMFPKFHNYLKVN
ncbi:unnamed protein product [Didymodactylos carnosus]|uniref:EF-hand domain-containing protein n=1 Tax=Didymodactylos carnosus TaxID=1234261 RepID=A0A8S2JYB0_9BILA|nr:unnamed protein product [Didymodactylos carnosus]CAF3831158.1 unnamed protein product [Didymodactylos carnosus]